jgi:hypothetical protein
MRTATNLLMQNKYFRQLTAHAVHQYWQTSEFKIDKEYLKKMSPQNSAEEQSSNFKNPLMHLLSSFDQSLYGNIDKGTTAKFFRDKGYEAIDWILAFSILGDFQVNITILAGIFIQIASTLETDPVMQMADEQLALQIYLSALSNARDHTTPDINLYTHIHCLKQIALFQFQEEELEFLIPILQQRTYNIVDIFALYHPFCSNITLLKNAQSNIEWIRQFLQQLYSIIKNNKECAEQDQTSGHIALDLTYVKVLHAIFEACLYKYYENIYQPQTEVIVKAELMKGMLVELGLTVSQFNANLQNPAIEIEYDTNGWMIPNNELRPYADPNTFEAIPIAFQI